MQSTTEDRRVCAGCREWIRFVMGASLLAGIVFGLMQGYTPPGPAGEVLRNNLRNRIDATPLFYTEVDSLVPDD